MPLNDGQPSTSTSDDQNSDTESSERCDSMTSSSDTECSRPSFTSGSSSKHSSPASSPPKMVTFDELMTAARDLSNLSLAHEIVVNGNFKVELPELPENRQTLMTDEIRLLELQKSLELYKAVAAVLLIVYNAIGGPISGLPVLADKLKKITSVLLEGIHIKSFNRAEALENVSAQICTELNKSLTERGYPALPAHVQVALTGQICTIVHKDNSISNLIDERVHSYMKLSIVPNSHTQPPAILGGLALIQPELEVFRAQFHSIVNFNKQVYCPFYGKILRKLLLSEAPQGTAEAGTPSVSAE
ncbi:UNVERIFIED_CONTAM: hypothetical protein FKN15_065741 [Acipenser sinensis]